VASLSASSKDVCGISNVLGRQPIDRQIEVLFQPSLALSRNFDGMRPQSTNGTAERIRRTLITISCGCAHSHQPRPMRALVITVEHCLSPGRTWVEVPAFVGYARGSIGKRGHSREPARTRGNARNHLNLRCLILKSTPSWRSGDRPSLPAPSLSSIAISPAIYRAQIENLEAALREPATTGRRSTVKANTSGTARRS
jgi:hypothetical protein